MTENQGKSCKGRVKNQLVERSTRNKKGIIVIKKGLYEKGRTSDETGSSCKYGRAFSPKENARIPRS